MDAFKNFAEATVSTGYDAAATSIVVTTGLGAVFPAVPFNAVWHESTTYPNPANDPNKEIVRVTAISTDTLTITRAQEGTSATTKNTAGKTYKLVAGLTAKTLNEDVPRFFDCYRITPTSGVPVITAEATEVTTLYVTPYRGNIMHLWNGVHWVPKTFTQKSFAVPSTTETGYDVFSYIDSSGEHAVEWVEWTNLTTRATELAYQDGRLVKSGDATRLYNGSFRTTEVSGQTEQSFRRAFIYNHAQQVELILNRAEPAVSWIYSTAALRQVNANPLNQVEVFVGVADKPISLDFVHIAVSGATGNFIAAIGENTTSAVATNCIGFADTRLAGYVLTLTSKLNTVPRLGWSYYAMLEMPTAACTWYSTLTFPGAVVVKHGFTGRIKM